MGEGTFFHEVQEFIRLLVSAVSSAKLYSPNHRQVLRLSGESFTRLRGALEQETEISILFVEDEVVCNNVPLDGSLSLGKFTRLFVSKGIGHLVFMREVEQDELRDLIIELSRQGDEAAEPPSPANIRLGRLKIAGSADGRSQEHTGKGGILGLDAIKEHEREVFRELCENIRNNKKFNMGEINGIVRSLVHAFQQASSPDTAFAVLSSLDRYTFVHSTNVCVLNLAQAMAMGIEGRLLHDIGVAGMLHDIGKLFIPEEILAKPHALTPSEREMIKEHPVRGAHYLLDLPGVPRLAVVCAYEHHMRFDGTGYPAAGAGWRQNMCSQMTTVSDFFDALRTRRSYRDSLAYDTIAAMMLEGAGTHFHPVLTRNFLRLLSQRPRTNAVPPPETPFEALSRPT